MVMRGPRGGFAQTGQRHGGPLSPSDNTLLRPLVHPDRRCPRW